MRSRLRTFIESVLYAGLKPDRGKQAPASPRSTGRLRRMFDRVVSGGSAPSDPLYLTNRTLGRKLRLPLLIGIPALVLAGFIVIALSNEYFRPKDTAPAELSPAEIAAKMLPDLNSVKIADNRDIEVVNVHVQSAGVLAGAIRNKTAHTIANVEALFDLADASGSRLGTVKAEIKSLAPNSATNFTVPIEQRDATFVIVRSTRSR